MVSRPMVEIQELYAFVVTNGPEGEGVMAFHGEDGKWFPMVGADLTRVESLKPIAKGIARATGAEYVIKRFKFVGEIPK